MAVLFAVAVAGVSAELLPAVPVLVVLVPLSLGRYIGEDAIARLVARRTPRRRRVARSASAPRARVGSLVLPRGGLLIASSLASRPPPVLVVSR